LLVNEFKPQYHKKKKNLRELEMFFKILMV
jgi:hypothetical protein